MSSNEATIPPQRYCRDCGYDLGGLATPRCPECGRAFDPNRPASWTDRPNGPYALRNTGKWVLIAFGLMPFELIACNAAYYTLGESLQGFCVCLFLAGLVLAALSLPIGSPRLTGALVILLALGIILPQIVLSAKLYRLKAEAQSIAAYLEQVRAARGAYPPSLAGYPFVRPDLASSIAYLPGQGAGGYSVHVWVLQRGISHDYSPAKGWHYYPD